MKNFILIVLFIFSLTACEKPQDEIEYYSAIDDSCAVSCGLDFETFKECHTKPAVEEYVRNMIPSLLYATEKVLKESKDNSCVCATVKISSDGTMSNARILKTNDKETALKIVKILNAFNVQPVPEEAMCLIESSFKEFPISLRK